MRKQGASKHPLTIVSLFLLLAILSIFLADLGTGLLRQRREDAIYDSVLLSARAYHVSPAMVMAVIRVESDFKADAHSSVGAQGLMQILPDTFRYLKKEHLHEDLSDKDLWDPTVNVRYGTYYLSYLFGRFGHWQAALAAYNAGEGRVAAWLADPTLSDGTVLFTIPFEETENYVARVLDAYREYLKKYQLKE